MSRLPADTLTTEGELIVTLAEAKEHCNLPAFDSSCEPLLGSYVRGAQQRLEFETHRAVTQQSRRVLLQRLCGLFIECPYGPLITVDTVQYHDGIQFQDVDAAVYHVDVEREPGGIWLNDGQSWPEAGRSFNGGVITYTSGMDSKHPLYQLARQAVLLLACEAWDCRSPVETLNNTAIGRWSTYDALRRKLSMGLWP